tara:strand:+ start:828 stop:1202 length:375 start_codon:yes stop_codon:yes gene_type:complete
MTEEQKAAAAERLRVAREKRLRDNPPKYANVHSSVLEKGDDHPFSRKKVVQWIKTQKSLLASERGNVRRKVKGAESKVADHTAYIRHCEWYLRNGDWIDDRYGEYQEKKTKWITIVPSGSVSTS